MRRWWVTTSSALVVLAALTTAAPLEAEEAQANTRAKRSEEMVMFGNHQNLPKVKKADPNMTPLKPQDNTMEEEEEEERRKAVDKIFKEDDEEEKSREAIEKIFAQDNAPIAEDMQHDKEESSGEEVEDTSVPENYYYNDYYYDVPRWLAAESVGREERSTDGRPKRSAIVAEDMMGGVRSSHAAMRLKRDLTEEQIRELLEGGSYGGDEYYNYPSFNMVEPDEAYPDYPAAAVEDYPEDYREYLEELMDNALLEADIAEQEEQQEKLEEAEAEQEYEEYLEEKQKELEEREDVQRALGLLRIMYENIPDEEEPIVGQREEVGPGYRVQETWQKYLPSGASIDQENVLTDYRPITYEGEDGIFIPLSTTEKRSNWGTLSAMPGMKKRGYVGFADTDKREAKRNYDEYGRLFRLARALRGDDY